MRTYFTFPCGCLSATDEHTKAGDHHCVHGSRLVCYGPNHFDARSEKRIGQLKAMNGSEIYAKMVEKYVGHYDDAPSWVTKCAAASPTAHLHETLKQLQRNPRSFLDIGSGSVGPSDFWHFNAQNMDHRITSDAFELRDDPGVADPAKWVFLLAFAQDLGGLLSNQRFDLIIIPETLEHIPIEEHTTVLDSAESLLSTQGVLYITSCNEVPHFHDQAREQCAVNPVGPFRNLPSCDMLRDRGYEVFWNKEYQILAYKVGR